jgi:phosphoribosylamine--glycine ligase/phosphoribosylformylglycinamidine cyclo-ligase
VRTDLHYQYNSMITLHIVGIPVDAAAWDLPAVFRFIKKEGNIAPLEMARTFNNGFGMVLVVAREDVEEVENLLQEQGETSVRIGELTNAPGVEMRNLEKWGG